MEQNGSDKPVKPDKKQMVAMLSTLLQRQTEDRQTNKDHLDEILQQQTRDKEDILQ